MLNVQFVQTSATRVDAKNVEDGIVKNISTDTQIVRRDDNGYC